MIDKEDVINTMIAGMDTEKDSHVWTITDEGLLGIAEDLIKLFSIPDVSVSFEEGYAKGCREATSEACKEIANNYTPNKRLYM